MEIDVDMNVRASDGPAGVVADLVVDPVRRAVTHVVVQPRHHHTVARLIPFEAVVGPIAPGHEVVLSWSQAEIADAPQVSQEDFIVIEPDDPSPPVAHGLPWVAWPYFATGALAAGVTPYVYGAGNGWVAEGRPRVVTTRIEKLPSGTVEIRRTSEVVSSDDHVVGRVDGFVVAAEGGITHLVLARGHLWGHRDVTIPIGDVASTTWDRVHLSRTRDEVGRYPSESFHRHHTRSSTSDPAHAPAS